MVGLPGQTLDDLASDLVFFKEIGADMIGIGPYITEPGTPVAARWEEEEGLVEAGLVEAAAASSASSPAATAAAASETTKTSRPEERETQSKLTWRPWSR